MEVKKTQPSGGLLGSYILLQHQWNARAHGAQQIDWGIDCFFFFLDCHQLFRFCFIAREKFYGHQAMINFFKEVT